MNSIQTLYGKCRCCQKAGEHRDVFKEYYCDGTREVYCDIFLDCFNVFLSISSGNSNLICVDCIQKLRDASNFRKMVVNAEKQLEFVKDSPDLETQLEVKIEPDDDYDYMETDYEDVELYQGLNTEKVPPDLEVKQEGERRKRGGREEEEEERKEKAGDDHDYMDTEFKDGKKTRSKNVKARPDRETKLGSKQKSDESHVTEKTAYVHNAQLILDHSNVTAFKGRSRVGLPCFCCKDLFDNIEALRIHQKEHKKSDIKKSLTSLSPYCFIVNVDITDLKCTLCDASLNTLEDFKTHLESEHNKKFYTEFEDRVIPFKLSMDNNYICQVCRLKFESFGSIERHMNGHFRNFNCDKCDRGFVTNHRLNTHVKTIHAEGSFQCDTCKKVFPSQQKLKSHVDTVHKMLKRFKCAKCPERFTAYFKRYQHLVEIHGQAELEYKCNVCDKVYRKRSMLSQHMKRDHLEERSVQCEICFSNFFSRKELNMHMIKHNGARTFECAVCKKAYARKKTLTEHMRIHNNDRRFSCAVCGLAFVQKYSLKGHMKTHHPEYVSGDK